MNIQRGFAMLDSLLAFMTLSLALSPLLVLQAQARRDLQQARTRDLALLLLVSLSEQVSLLPRNDSHGALSLDIRRQFQAQCPRCRNVSVSFQAYIRSNSQREAPAYQIALSWDDPLPQKLRIMALRSDE
jgi:Tfp pilus assembly protein PilV